MRTINDSSWIPITVIFLVVIIFMAAVIFRMSRFPAPPEEEVSYTVVEPTPFPDCYDGVVGVEMPGSLGQPSYRILGYALVCAYDWQIFPVEEGRSE